MASSKHELMNSALALVLGCAALSGAEAQVRFELTPDGLEVKDHRTGLTWRRCSEGQVLEGSNCSGFGTVFTHEQALSHARSQTGWRLPNVKELASLVDYAYRAPAIDRATFPATPAGPAWTSSPYALPDVSLAVDFARGGVSFEDRRTSVYHVRLVRR
jgi:Protein of unknown function (DUF1566)